MAGKSLDGLLHRNFKVGIGEDIRTNRSNDAFHFVKKSKRVSIPLS